MQVLEPGCIGMRYKISYRVEQAGGNANDALVHRTEFGDVQSVGEDSICVDQRGKFPVRKTGKANSKKERQRTRFPLQKMFTLIRRNMTNSSKHIGTMRRTPLNAITMINPPLARFVVDIKVGEVVVKVDGTSAEVSSEESRVRSEDGGDVDVAFATEGDRETGEPFVEVGDDGL